MHSHTDLATLHDTDLSRLAWQYRREAMRGNRDAFGMAHELEKEVRRRGAAQGHPQDHTNSQIGGLGVGLREDSLHIVLEPKGPWWRFWN